MTKLELIAQGAEARLYYTDSFLGKPAVLKERFVKSYRHPTLDTRLRQSQIRDEVKSMVKARTHGIDTPTVYFVDGESNTIYMEFIEGRTVRELLTADILDESCTMKCLCYSAHV
jgi:TP53 regulating kinase-like protein